jgi:hypothetical protein
VCCVVKSDRCFVCQHLGGHGKPVSHARSRLAADASPRHIMQSSKDVNVKVIVRCRPLNGKEKASAFKMCVVCESASVCARVCGLMHPHWPVPAQVRDDGHTPWTDHRDKSRGACSGSGGLPTAAASSLTVPLQSQEPKAFTFDTVYDWE